MTGPARRRTRRVPWLVAAVTALLAPLGASAASAASADPTPSPSPTDELPLTLQLQGVSPLAPQPGQELVVRGRLTNGSSETITGLQPRLLVSPSRVSSR